MPWRRNDEEAGGQVESMIYMRGREGRGCEAIEEGMQSLRAISDASAKRALAGLRSAFCAADMLPGLRRRAQEGKCREGRCGGIEHKLTKFPKEYQ